MYHDPCPPDSLETVIKNDARFRWKHGELTKATRYDSLYSALGLEETDLLDLFEEKPRKKPRRGSRHNESAQQVYRFRAALRHDKTLWRLIEIRGNQSLRVLDQEMRAAFGHDSSDHLSEFYLGVDADARRRGLGMHVPFEKGEGDAWLVGELGLVEGDELSYTYDFGDNIQHVLQLKAVIPPEPRVKYPRIVEQNKPRYHYCPVCKQEGKKEIATWICIDCSNDEQRNVLICQDHVTLDHKDHYIQEITY